MKIKPQNFIISLRVYPFDVMVSIGEEDEVLFKKLVKRGINKEEVEDVKYEDIGLARFCSFTNGAMIIRLKKRPKTPKEYSTLQHEIFHVVATLMWKVGMKLKVLSSDEAYAYLIGFLTEEIYTKMV